MNPKQLGAPRLNDSMSSKFRQILQPGIAIHLNFAALTIRERVETNKRATNKYQKETKQAKI